MIYEAKIENNIVVAVVSSPFVGWAVENIGGEWITLKEHNQCAIGWIWDGEKFSAPKIEEITNELEN